MVERIRVAALDPAADRSSFRCGVGALDRYFATQASQDVRRRVAACFVATSPAGAIAGYYTLASASIGLGDLPENLARKLPRYPNVPAVRLGRLAVATAFKGQGLGAALLADALRRAATAEIAAYALIVDAKDEEAARFYAHHGFEGFAAQPLLLFLPLAVVKGL
jgi:GNAT superfamily N-acetyltransferase